MTAHRFGAMGGHRPPLQFLRYNFQTWRMHMTRFRSSRLLLVAGCVVALVAGTVISAQRSSGTMASAASALVNSLSADQRLKAMFPFQSNERLHWNFIPSEMFPRNGLLMKDMSETQRKLVHNLLKSA